MSASEAPEIVIGKHGERRLKGKEMVIPVVAGTIAFYLGKKATEYQSHRWTAYLRSANGEDLSHVIKKVVFVLHPSFNNPERAIEFPPWELTECGWGEFDVGMQIHFHDDAYMDGPVELYHRLRLYDETGVNNAKKPVVSETYEEIVMWEPAENFYNRVQAMPTRPAPPSQLAQFHSQFTPEAEYKKIQLVRQRVADLTAKYKGQLAQLDAAG